MSSKKNTATNGQVIVRKSTQSKSNKRKQCFKCKEFVSVDCMRLHSKYYCGAQPDEKEWKLRSSKGFCLSCNKVQTPNVIEFHVKYLCGKKPITVQCFYCPNFYNNYRRLLTHMLNVHKKRHCYLDLMSILPPADPITTAGKPTKVVRHFFNNILSGEGKTLDGAMDRCLQVRKKTTYRCQSCGKFLDGIHAYQNHINTKCESERHYSCFFCSFKADLVYESLEHMESIHNQQFNTYDIIQAKLTGIIPTVDMATAGPLCEDVEVNFTKPESCKLNTTKINDEYNKDQERNVSPLITYNKQCISQDCVLSKKRAVRANVKLTVAKRKVNIGIKNMRRGNKKYKQLIKKKCPKCCKEIHPTETRIHTKYHCNKEPGKNEWILKSGKALCLRCGKLQMSNLIDFHVMYGCSSRKKRFLIQCFYCTQIFREYRKLITHMKMAHNKSHYYADLMTILPNPDAIGQKDEEEVSTVIKHPKTYLPQSKKDQDALGGSGSPAIAKFPAYENFHSCFYCAYKNTAGYKVLEHMQEVHGKNYNIYDLLEFKMVGNAKTKNI